MTFQVSAELLQDVEETVNGSLVVKYFHIWTFSLRIILLLFLHLLIVIFIIFLILFITTSGREKTDSFQPADYALAIGLPLWFISLFSTESLCLFHRTACKGIYGVKIRVNILSFFKTFFEAEINTCMLFILNYFNNCT